MTARERGPRPLIVGEDVEFKLERKDEKVRLQRLSELVSDMHVGKALPPGRFGSIVTREVFAELQRDLSVATSAQYMAKSSQPVDVLQYLFSRMVCLAAGAQTGNPRGDYSSVPVTSGVGSSYWIDPNGGAIGESDLTFSVRNLLARLQAAAVDVSRNANVVTNGLAQRTVMRALADLNAVGWDAAALVRTGVDNQTLGIANVPGVGSTSGATFSTTTAAELIRLVETGNGTPTGFMLSPYVASLFRTRPRFAGGDTPLLSDGKIADVPVFVTTSMPDDKVICGDFRRLVFLLEDVEILINRYTQSKAGNIEVVLYSFGDLYVEHPAAFAVATEVS